MREKVYIAIICIVSLFLGAVIGASYERSKSASADTSTVAVSTPSTVVASSVDTAYAYEMGRAIAADTLAQNSGLTVSSASSPLRSFLVGTAHAQSTCAIGNLSSIIDFVTKEFFKNLDNGCANIVIDINVTATVYRKTDGTSWAAEVHGTIKGKRKEYDETCKLNTTNINAKIDLYGIYNPATNKLEPAASIPAGYRAVCSVSISTHRDVGTLDKTKCPFCKKTPTPSATAATLPPTTN